MINFEFFNHLPFFLPSGSWSLFSLLLTPESFSLIPSTLSSILPWSFFNNNNDPETILLIRQGSIFLLNLTSYLYIFLKFYKVLCYSKMTFEWLPMINPYIWPFSIFQVLTGPYFAFWTKILPSIKLDKSSVEISGIIALEALNSFIYFCVRFTNHLLMILEETEKTNILY